MRIDRQHRTWVVWTVALTALSTTAYLWYAWRSPVGPRGGSTMGLIFGASGTLLMVWAGLLSARKKLPRWQKLGSAQFWLKSHIWLGLLSGPLILFHAGFRWGGLLEQVLLAVFLAVYASGVLGVIFQSLMPRQMKTEVPGQPIFEAVGDAAGVLLARADQLVQSVSRELAAPASERPGPEEQLRRLYVAEIRPFLARPLESSGLLQKRTRLQGTVGTEYQSKRLFAELRYNMPSRPESLLKTVEFLDNACRERRQMGRLVRMQWWLHGWLLLHVPLSLVMLILGIAHVVMSSLWY